jgi:hypothetical protein
VLSPRNAGGCFALPSPLDLLRTDTVGGWLLGVGVSAGTSLWRVVSLFKCLATHSGKLRTSSISDRYNTFRYPSNFWSISASRTAVNFVTYNIVCHAPLIIQPFSAYFSDNSLMYCIGIQIYIPVEIHGRADG